VFVCELRGQEFNRIVGCFGDVVDERRSNFERLILDRKVTS
jgi:hypothetical protein